MLELAVQGGNKVSRENLNDFLAWYNTAPASRDIGGHVPEYR